MKTWKKILLWVLITVILFTVTVYGTSFIYSQLLLDKHYQKWKKGIESKISKLQSQIEEVQEEIEDLESNTDDLEWRVDDLESQVGDLQDCCEECF